MNNTSKPSIDVDFICILHVLNCYEVRLQYYYFTRRFHYSTIPILMLRLLDVSITWRFRSLAITQRFHYSAFPYVGHLFIFTRRFTVTVFRRRSVENERSLPQKVTGSVAIICSSLNSSYKHMKIIAYVRRMSNQMCPTRRVERYGTVLVFIELIKPALYCLETISEWPLAR